MHRHSLLVRHGLLIASGAALILAGSLAGSGFAGPNGGADTGLDRAAAPPPQSGGLRPVRVIGGVDGPELFEVKDAAFHGSDLVVLTGSMPAVHLFSGGRYRKWGGKGEGPSELLDPADVAWVGNHILVRDFRQGKIVSYGVGGNFVTSRTPGPFLVNRMEMAGADTLVGTVDLNRGLRAVVRVRQERYDTILRYQLPREIRLEAGGAPSLTVVPPFAPVTQWAALPSGRVAVWDPQTSEIRVTDMRRQVVGRIRVPPARYPVGEADREQWISTEIPREFMGRRVFEPLRRKARDQVKFPSQFPPVLAIMVDPVGSLWVRRTTEGSGEVWTRLTAAGAGPTVRLPPGRRLLAIGEAEMAARAVDDLDVESIEIYRKPAGGR